MKLKDKVQRNQQSDMSPLVIMALRRIIRAIDLHSRSLVQRYGLTGPQLIVLKELLDAPPMTVGALAQAVHLSQATVTGILDRLEKRRLIERTRSTADKRRVFVTVTSNCQEVLANAPPLLQEHFTATFCQLPDWEQAQILSSLLRIVSLMEAREIDAIPILTTGPIEGKAEKTEAYVGPRTAPEESDEVTTNEPTT